MGVEDLRGRNLQDAALVFGLLHAIEECREGPRRYARLTQDRHRPSIGLALGFARVAELYEQHAQAREVVPSPGQKDFAERRQAEQSDDRRFGVKLKGMPSAGLIISIAPSARPACMIGAMMMDRAPPIVW